MSSRLSGDVAVVTLDFPPVNALDLEAVEELKSCFEGFAGDRPLVITGAGRAFSAGVDTRAWASYSAEQRCRLFESITGTVATLCAIETPVVAAVNGHAMGGGLVLALCADYRIAVDADHRFALSEAQAGVPFPAGPVEVIRHELPGTLLRQLTLSSRVVSARVLHRHAVFDELARAETLMDAALESARALAAQPAFAEVKRQVRGGLSERLAALVV